MSLCVALFAVPKGGCCSISDDLSCSSIKIVNERILAFQTRGTSFLKINVILTDFILFLLFTYPAKDVFMEFHFYCPKSNDFREDKYERYDRLCGQLGK